MIIIIPKRITKYPKIAVGNHKIKTFLKIQYISTVAHENDRISLT